MRRIAIVEDNPDNRLLLEAFLHGRYETVAFENGVDAVAHLPREAAELILLDISLPGMDGVEVLRRLRQIPETARIPAIALTAHAMTGDRERFLASGFDDYMSKPILDMDLLFQTMDRAMAAAKKPSYSVSPG